MLEDSLNSQNLTCPTITALLFNMMNKHFGFCCLFFFAPFGNIYHVACLRDGPVERFHVKSIDSIK